jgi:hypothetical protein
MRVFLAALILCWCGLTLANSQVSALSSMDPAQNPPADTGAARDASADNGRKPDAMLISSATSRPGNLAGRAHAKADAKDYWTSEWWLVYVTVLLSLVTTALAVWTGGLYRATKALALDAAATAEKQAKQIDRAFVTANRPRIVVRAFAPIFVDTESADDLIGGIDFLVANIGGTTGTISHSRITSRRVERGGHDIPPLFGNAIHLNFGVGNVLKASDTAAAQLTLDSPLHRLSISGELEFVVYGYILYDDENGLRRHTYFYRIFDSLTHRFRKSDDEDLEYEY